MFSGIPPTPMREQILNDIWRRSMVHVNCDEFTGFMLCSTTRSIRIPPVRPSDPENFRHENCIELKAEFSAPSSFAEDFRSTFPKGKTDRLLELVVSADAFFSSAREFGLEVLHYCEDIRERLRLEFGIKNTDESPDINNDEYAHYELLAVFIVERQLGITKSGFFALNGPIIKGEQYIGLNLHSNGKVLYGPVNTIETRRAFIDQLILSSERAKDMAPYLAELRRRAVELNRQFGTEVNRIRDAAEKAEREGQGADTKVDRILKRIKNNTVMAVIIVIGIGSMAVIGLATSVATVISWFH